MGTQRSASNHFDESISACGTCLYRFPEIGHVGSGEPGLAGSKATATVLPAITSQRPCGVSTEPFGLAK